MMLGAKGISSQDVFNIDVVETGRREFGKRYLQIMESVAWMFQDKSRLCKLLCVPPGCAVSGTDLQQSVPENRGIFPPGKEKTGWKL